MKNKTVAHYVIYLDDWFLEDSVENAINFVDKVLIARTLQPWNGRPADLTETENTLKRLKARFGSKIEIYEGNFENEQEQRNFLIEKSKSEGYDGAFIIDSDEIFLPPAFDFLYSVIEQNTPKAIRASYLTFIKDTSFCISAPYETNLFYVSLKHDVHFEWARKTNTEPLLIETESPEILHFSYLRKSDKDIEQKIENFMHNKDADWENWYNEVYIKFNKKLKNFHPVWPEAWTGVQLFDVSKFPKSLFDKLKSNNKLFYYDKILNNTDIKLHLGCGDKIFPDYVNIDLYSQKADLNLDIVDLSYFDDSTVSEIFMNAVFEHIYDFQQIPALIEWRRVLKPGGKLIINSIPDFDIYAKAYFEGAPGNTQKTFDLYEVSRYTHGEYKEENRFGQIHKDIFTKDKVRKLLTDAGFQISKLENVHWETEPVPCNINLVAIKPNEVQEDINLAEKYLQDNDFDSAKMVLNKILSQNPNDVDALIDLAVIETQENNWQNAQNLLEKVIELEPGNEVAINNYHFLATKTGFNLNGEKVKNITEFLSFQQNNKEKLNGLIKTQRHFRNQNNGHITGICAVCGEITNFLYQVNDSEINWREELVCDSCKLNSRLRASVHYLLTSPEFSENSKIYMTEQSTPLFKLLSENLPDVVGSEFLGNSLPLGNINSLGIRNEDATQLTFPDSSFDFVLSFEVLEHIPNYKAALAEFSRILKPGGKLILTAPFVSNSQQTITKAYVDDSGSVRTIGTPEYHGDPVNPEKGSLCFYHFGWELLEEIKNSGFKESFNFYTYSRFYGYLDLINLIIGIK